MNFSSQPLTNHPGYVIIRDMETTTKPEAKMNTSETQKVDCQVTKVTHHTDAGYRYSRVYYRFPDGTTSMVFQPGHREQGGTIRTWAPDSPRSDTQ